MWPNNIPPLTQVSLSASTSASLSRPKTLPTFAQQSDRQLFLGVVLVSSGSSPEVERVVLPEDLTGLHRWWLAFADSERSILWEGEGGSRKIRTRVEGLSVFVTRSVILF
jgi:hypothetical protein